MWKIFLSLVAMLILFQDTVKAENIPVAYVISRETLNISKRVTRCVFHPLFLQDRRFSVMEIVEHLNSLKSYKTYNANGKLTQIRFKAFTLERETEGYELEYVTARMPNGDCGKYLIPIVKNPPEAKLSKKKVFTNEKFSMFSDKLQRNEENLFKMALCSVKNHPKVYLEGNISLCSLAESIKKIKRNRIYHFYDGKDSYLVRSYVGVLNALVLYKIKDNDLIPMIGFASNKTEAELRYIDTIVGAIDLDADGINELILYFQSNWEPGMDYYDYIKLKNGVWQ